MLRLHRVVEPVRLDDAAHIGRARHISMAYPPVDDHVMETEIDRSIGSDAAADPCPGIAPAKPHACKEAEDRGCGEHYGEPIVLFEQAVARLVVAFVKRPEKAVHHPAMGGIGDALHHGDGGKDDQQAVRNVHPIAYRPGQVIRPDGEGLVRLPFSFAPARSG